MIINNIRSINRIQRIRIKLNLIHMNKHTRAVSLEDLTSHQQRIRSIVKKITQYSPTFHLNPAYDHSRIIKKIKTQRQTEADRLFQQNIKIIDKLQNIQPKVNTKYFPSVNLSVRSKRKCSSLSSLKSKLSQDKSKKNLKKEDELLQQNLQMIEKLQTIDKRINCWQDKSLLKSRVIREKKQKQKRNEILEKFKQISIEMKSLRAKNDQSIIIEKSPYIRDKTTKQSQASFSTKVCSFLASKPFK